MRILHVICTTSAESGGPVEALLRISEVLVREGHQVHVVSLEHSGEIATPSFPISITGVGRGLGKYRFNPSLTHWLNQHVQSYDVVILHGLWNYSSLGAWRALRRNRTPYFVFAHGMMDPWFRQSYPIKHLFKQAYWMLFEGRVLRDSQAVLFTCEEERLRARGVFGGHHYRELVTLLGTAEPSGDETLDEGSFLAAFPQFRDKRYLLFLGRVHPKKGCDLLVEAFAQCSAHLPPDLDIVMAGPDEVGWVPELQAKAKKLGVAGRVHWTGMLRGPLKWGALRRAEALILPSHQENFGFVVAEAMACSTPVLLSNKVNIWREVEASNAGLVEQDTVEGTRKLIMRFCLASAESRVRMALNARASFLKNFDVEVTVPGFIKHIEYLSYQPVYAGAAR
jgi:glycosyltransferase involved in cell wall biosynthesis